MDLNHGLKNRLENMYMDNTALTKDLGVLAASSEKWARFLSPVASREQTALPPTPPPPPEPALSLRLEPRPSAFPVMSKSGSGFFLANL